MDQDPVRIMMVADTAYFPHVPTTINGVLRNTSGPVEIGVLAQGVSETSRAECLSHFPNHHVAFHDIDLRRLADLKAKRSLSPMAFARVLMPNLVGWDGFL